MPEPDNYLVAGKLLTFTSGEYSDYSMHDTYVALETVSVEEVTVIATAINKKAQRHINEMGWYDGEPQAEFQAELIRRGWLLSVENTERHLGSYGDLNL